MHSEVAWVLVCLGTQVQPQIILEPGYLPDNLSVFYYYGNTLKQHEDLATDKEGCVTENLKSIENRSKRSHMSALH